MADTAPPAAARLRSAVTLALAGGASLCIVLLIHEFLAFGVAPNDMIAPAGTPCPDPPCLTSGMVVSGAVAKGVGAGMILAIIGAIWTSGPARWAIAGGYWVVQYLWSLIGIASGYRLHFGTGWTWWEPFAELLWNPVTTPALMLAGLVGCLGIDRLARPWCLPGAAG